MDLPYLPGRLSARPEFFQPLLVPQSIHSLPEAAVEVGLYLLLQRQAFQHIALKHCGIIGNLAQDPWGQYEEATIDPSALTFGLLLKGIDSRLFDPQGPEASRRLDGC